MRRQKRELKGAEIRGLCWRVWVTVRGKRHIGAVAEIIDVPTASEAAAVVMNTWTNDDWDSEAFAFRDRAGNWRYYRLRNADEIVLERVNAAHDLMPPARAPN